jgi:ATP-dependent protease ClpP protease subunit
MYNGIESLVRNDVWQITIGLPVLIAYLILSRLVLFPWQVVGLLRSCEKHFLRHGHPIRIRSIQGLIIVVIMMNAVGVVDTMHWYLLLQKRALDEANISETKNYSLSLQKDASLIYLTGSFDFGITNDMEAMLIKNSGTRGIVLNSTGGFVSEGRGIFRLIDQYKLDTFVYDECSSACALAFIAGNKRYMAANARLGFHQYNLEIQTAFQPVDIVQAQKDDLELLRKKHISSHFLEQVFKQPSHLIWFPTVKELLDYGVVDAHIGEQLGNQNAHKSIPVN